MKRKCICKDGVYHCRTVYPTVGYEVFVTRVQKWLSGNIHIIIVVEHNSNVRKTILIIISTVYFLENYDPQCVTKTQELIIKGWTCLCLEKKTYWCTKLPKKEIIPILREP